MALERDPEERSVRIPAGGRELIGDLVVPEASRRVAVFAHGSGSGRHSPRNREVARVLRSRGLGTLLVDLLTVEEELADAQTGHLRFDIPLLAERLARIAAWLGEAPATRQRDLGYFGASTGAAAALVAAADRPERIAAIVSRGGRPDLAGEALRRVRAPALLIVGGADRPVLELNRRALEQLPVEKRLEVIPGAGHLFEEPGALARVAALAADWLTRPRSPAVSASGVP